MKDTQALERTHAASPEAEVPTSPERPQAAPPKARVLGGAESWRIVVLCGLFLASAFFVQTVGHGRPVPLEKALRQFPQVIGPWQGGADEVLPENIVQVLGVDDYVSRYYSGPDGSVHLYASYFSTTWGGKSYHSPRNCMPGSGWDVTKLEVVPLSVANPHPHTVQVSRMLMQKGAEHEVVLYWYQGRGRIMATEYAERVYRVVDSLIHGRTEGAFVRIIVPVHGRDIDAAMGTAVVFAQHIIPLINDFLPQ